MNLKILELDEEKDRLVLSNRKNAFNTRRQITVSPLPLHCDMLERIEFLNFTLVWHLLHECTKEVIALLVQATPLILRRIRCIACAHGCSGHVLLPCSCRCRQVPSHACEDLVLT
jgi:hypothetical protein